MPACLALTREHEPWRAANRASAISCGASHLRLKSATGIHTLHHTDCSQDCGLRGMCRAASSPAGFRRPPRHECHLRGTRMRLLRRLHQCQAVFCHKANIGRAVSMKPPITAASSMPPYHVNRDILLPEQQVDCRAMGIATPFVDIRVPRRRRSCRGACREPKVGTARRRLTKVDGTGMSNGSRIACNSTFKSKRRRAVPAAKPLGKPPRFVVARSANPICRHIWNSICGIAAMLTNRVFAHKSPGTPYNCRFQGAHLRFLTVVLDF